MAQKILGVNVGQSLWSLSYLTKIPTLTLPPKNFEGSKFFIIFSFFGFTKFKPVVLKIETFLTSRNLTKK